jgi:hypothetical protein
VTVRPPECRQSPVIGVWLVRLDGNHALYLPPGRCRHESSCIHARQGARENTLENMCCLRCKREIESGQKSVAVYMFAQTVGIKPRQKSSAHRITFCPQCSVSLAMGLPPEGALNMAAWDMIRDLVSAHPSLNDAAWETLRGIVGLLPEADHQSPSVEPSDAWVNARRRTG